MCALCGSPGMFHDPSFQQQLRERFYADVPQPSLTMGSQFGSALQRQAAIFRPVAPMQGGFRIVHSTGVNSGVYGASAIDMDAVVTQLRDLLNQLMQILQSIGGITPIPLGPGTGGVLIPIGGQPKPIPGDDDTDTGTDDTDTTSNDIVSDSLVTKGSNGLSWNSNETSATALNGKVTVKSSMQLADDGAKAVDYLYTHSSTFKNMVDNATDESGNPQRVEMTIVNGGGSYCEMSPGVRRVVIDISQVNQVMQQAGMGEDDLGEAFAYVIAHELGHAFGDFTDSADGSGSSSSIGTNQINTAKIAAEALGHSGDPHQYNHELDGENLEWS